MYETLSHTIAKRRQQDYTVAYYGISYNPSQRSLQELEQVRTEMIQELKRLLDDMAGSGHSSENVDQAAVRRLQSHTLQLQKHGQRIQTILDHP
ncbi:hypothetical protein [Spirosoma agri]|uniref:Uncharacterized protein n=1 Tax=Spirosoma agri TaxID=1987381 RepID=A0A6M0ILQ5_9BACT|nr:hypothetical protein [Spirosoma agri]NEU67823.1 hypothetical protein [Spirosoma agri]